MSKKSNKSKKTLSRFFPRDEKIKYIFEVQFVLLQFLINKSEEKMKIIDSKKYETKFEIGGQVLL